MPRALTPRSHKSNDKLILPKNKSKIGSVPECEPCKKEVDPCEKPKVECDPCKKEVDPCGRQQSVGHKWGWLGALILWGIIFAVLFWLLFYSLKPEFVLKDNTDEVDTGKVLLSAVIAALILIAIIGLIRLAVRKMYRK